MCHHGRVGRRLIVLIATLACAVGAFAPVSRAEYIPWFAPKVGNATQVISVVGDGGSKAKVGIRAAGQWVSTAA